MDAFTQQDLELIGEGLTVLAEVATTTIKSLESGPGMHLTETLRQALGEKQCDEVVSRFEVAIDKGRVKHERIVLLQARLIQMLQSQAADRLGE